MSVILSFVFRVTCRTGTCNTFESLVIVKLCGVLVFRIPFVLYQYQKDMVGFVMLCFFVDLV